VSARKGFEQDRALFQKLEDKPGAGDIGVAPEEFARSLLVQLGDNAEFFHTPRREAFISCSVNGRVETWPLASREFAYLLRQRYCRATAAVPPKQALEDLVNILDTCEHNSRVPSNLCLSALQKSPRGGEVSKGLST
jgi:hypothetical protein